MFAWGESTYAHPVTPGGPYTVCDADITGDGLVTVTDFLILRSFLNQSCVPPEPPVIIPPEEPIIVTADNGVVAEAISIHRRIFADRAGSFIITDPDIDDWIILWGFNDLKALPESEVYFNMTLDGTATVYFGAFSNTTIPSWLVSMGFIGTDLTLDTTGDNVPAAVLWEAEFGSGTYAFMGRGGADTGTNYFLVLPVGSGGQPLPPGTGTATLTWTAPTQNSCGPATPSIPEGDPGYCPPLDDLAGYKVYWGTQLGNYPFSEPINDPGMLTHTVTGLAVGTWYFVVTALDTSGNESVYSNSDSKEITE